MPATGLSLGGVGGGFDPRSLSSLQMWLSARRALATTADSSALSAWTDLSGVGNDGANSGAAGTKPTLRTSTWTGSRRTVEWDGGDTMTCPVSMAFKPFTFIFVVRFTSFAAIRRLLAPSVNGGWGIDIQTSGRVDLIRFNVATIASSSSNLSSGTDYVLSIVYTSSGGWGIIANGTAIGAGTNNVTPTASTAIIGSGPSVSLPHLGHMPEVLIFNTDLSTTVRQDTERMLGHEYGITVA